MRRAVRAHAHARCTVTPADAAVIDPRHLGSTAALAGRLVLVLARLDDDGVGLLARVQLVIRELRRLDAERRPYERARQRDVVPVLAGRLPHARRGLPLERLRLAHQTRPMIRPPRRARHDVCRGDDRRGRGLRDHVDHEARRLLARFGLRAREPLVEAAECRNQVRDCKLGLRRLRARRGLRGIERRELARRSGRRRAARRRDREIRERRRRELAHRGRLGLRRSPAREREIALCDQRRALRPQRRRRRGARTVRLAPRRDVALAARVEHAHAFALHRQRLVHQDRRHAFDHDPLLARRDREHAAPRDRGAILEDRDGNDRRRHDSLRLPPTSSCLPAILISYVARSVFLVAGASETFQRWPPRRRSSFGADGSGVQRSHAGSTLPLATSMSSSLSSATGTLSRTSTSTARAPRFSMSLALAWTRRNPPRSTPVASTSYPTLRASLTCGSTPRPSSTSP